MDNAPRNLNNSQKGLAQLHLKVSKRKLAVGNVPLDDEIQRVTNNSCLLLVAFASLLYLEIKVHCSHSLIGDKIHI